MRLIAGCASRKSTLVQYAFLPPIAAVGGRVREMSGAVHLHGQTGIGAREIDLQSSETVERNRQRDIDAETSSRFRERLQAPTEKCLRRARGPICALGVWRHGSHGVDEHARVRCVDTI